MAFALVQSAGGADASGSSNVITVASTGAGNLVVVHIYVRSTTATVTSITDNQGNTYVIGTVFTGNRRVYQAYGMQITGGVTAITVNYSASVLNAAGADEFSGFTAGATNADVYDTRSTGTNPGSSPYTISVSPALAPAATGELIVATKGSVSSGETWAAGSGYTLSVGTTGRLRGEYKLSGTTSETAPFTTSYTDGADEIAQAFKVGVSSAIKTVNGLVKASVKTFNSLPIASVKTINGLS